MELEQRAITIPSRAEHDGFHSMTVTLPWVCIHCGAPRGEPFKSTSWDGRRQLEVDSWHNPCGHVEKYSELRMWMTARGAERLAAYRALSTDDRASL